MTTLPSEPTKTSVRLILVRHAAHADLGQRLTGRARAVSLSEAGRRQAVTLARHLAAEGIAAIHTSPRERARDTAAAIAAATGAPVTIADALDEIDFGDWTGARFDALDGRPDWEAWNRRRGTTRAPGGESMAEAVGRIAAYTVRLAAGPAGPFALVTHCDMIRGLVAHCLGLSLDNLLRFEIGPASMTRIEAGPWGARVISLNEQPCPL